MESYQSDFNQFNKKFREYFEASKKLAELFQGLISARYNQADLAEYLGQEELTMHLFQEQKKAFDKLINKPKR